MKKIRVDLWNGNYLTADMEDDVAKNTVEKLAAGGDLNFIDKGMTIFIPFHAIQMFKVEHEGS